MVLSSSSNTLGSDVGGCPMLSVTCDSFNNLELTGKSNNLKN